MAIHLYKTSTPSTRNGAVDSQSNPRNNNSVYQYVWSWTINNDFYLEFGCLVDPLTSIMSILITTVGMMVLINWAKEIT